LLLNGYYKLFLAAAVLSLIPAYCASNSNQNGLRICSGMMHHDFQLMVVP